jgi:hypothetical protein
MRTNLLAGVAAAGILCLGGTVPANLVTATGSSYAGCATAAPGGARLEKGATVRDPNSVSAARAAAMDRRLHATLAAKGYSTMPMTLPPGSVNINVYMHVITKNDGTGGPTPSMIVRQMHELDRAYGGLTSKRAAATPFQFTLKSVDYTANSDWYHWAYPGHDPSDDREAKKALHEGTYADLNVYVAHLSHGLLGYANFPGGRLWADGLVMLGDSMPGGSATGYNLGDTATHEIGHWLGLFHTFQNGCKPPGDRVADTPAQADGDNIFNCEKHEDTCTAKPGVDPIHNFMNYSDDLCMNLFTPGQAQRMSDTWVAYRQGR